MAYAGAALGRLDPKGVWSLLANFLGALRHPEFRCLMANFNLASTAMEGSWALVALAGLVRLAILKRRG